MMETFPVRIQNTKAVLRIRDVYPGSRISDPASNNSNKRGGEKNLPYLFCSHKIHEIKNCYIFEQTHKKIELIDKEI